MKRPPSARHTPGSGGAATEPVDILGEREGDELKRFGHRWIDVDHIDEVIRGGPEAQVRPTTATWGSVKIVRGMTR